MSLDVSKEYTSLEILHLIKVQTQFQSLDQIPLEKNDILNCFYISMWIVCSRFLNEMSEWKKDAPTKYFHWIARIISDNPSLKKHSNTLRGRSESKKCGDKSFRIFRGKWWRWAWSWGKISKSLQGQFCFFGYLFWNRIKFTLIYKYITWRVRAHFKSIYNLLTEHPS